MLSNLSWLISRKRLIFAILIDIFTFLAFVITNGSINSLYQYSSEYVTFIVLWIFFGYSIGRYSYTWHRPLILIFRQVVSTGLLTLVLLTFYYIYYLFLSKKIFLIDSFNIETILLYVSLASVTSQSFIHIIFS